LSFRSLHSSAQSPARSASDVLPGARLANRGR